VPEPGPNKGVERTASSVRSYLAPACSRSSRLAFGDSARPVSIQLLNRTTNDGSRWFAELPESRSFDALRDHLRALHGVRITEFLTDHVTEAWIDFTFRHHTFTINNQYGDYWLFVREPSRPDDILSEVVSHCQPFLHENVA